MGTVINLSERKTELGSHLRQLTRTLRDLDVTIQTTEAALRLTELKVFRTSLNQMKNAKYVLQKEINKLNSGS